MRRFFAAAVALLLLVPLAGCAKKGPSLESTVDFVLEVEAGREVKILQLSDIQIIDSSQQRVQGTLPEASVKNWAPERLPELAWKYTRKAVEAAKPDLIVLSGDNVYGRFDDSGAMLDALIAEMESYNTPWTFVFGNHDNETALGVEETVRRYQAAPHCLFKRGPVETVDGEEYLSVEGNGNFTIGITQGGELTEVLYLMDSNGHTDSDRDQNMYSTAGLKEKQIAWFEETAEKLKTLYGENPKSIGFFHHPVRAVGDGLQQYGYVSFVHGFASADPTASFRPVVIPENDSGDSGSLHKDPLTYIDEEYAFHALLKEYGCEGWFFGHEHEDNASVTFDGVRYTFGLKSSLYDSFYAGEIGGTLITVGNGLRVEQIVCA